MTVHPHALKTIFEIFDPPKQSGDVGVELEIEGTNLPHDVVGFTEKPENSLRGESVEYVTKGAMTRGTLDTRLTDLCEKLQGRAKLTVRASTHIHLNMQRCTVRVFLGTLILFTCIEPLLLRICGPLRNGNLFCMPTYDTGDITQYTESLSHYLIHGAYSSWPKRGKYASLNIDPVREFGSIEFRCFPNSVDKDEILKWCDWVINIRRKAYYWSDDTYGTLVDFAYNYPEQLAIEMFPGQEGLHRFAAPQNIGDLIRGGAEQAYEIYRAAKRVLNFQAAEEKEAAKKTKGSKRKASWAVDTGFDVPDLEPDMVEDDE
jgi:hypothetical protein